MRKLTVYILPLIFLSCTGNHYHDGRYKANVFNSTMTWVTEQQVELDGNTMHVTYLSVADHSIQGEYKTTCKQFQDRIEFMDKDGIEAVARFDENGNIKYGDYTYEKITDGDTTSISPSEQSKPLIKKNDDGTITLLPEKKPDNLFTGVKRFEDEDGIYSREVTIKGNNITIKLFAGSKNTDYPDKTKPLNIETGYIKNGKVFIKDGKEYKSNLYRIENGELIVNYDTGD